MTSHDEHPLDFLPELALGVLPASDAASVEAHLASCESCRAEYDEMSRVARLLPLASEDTEPSPELKGGVMERIAMEPRPLAAARQGRIVRPNWAWTTGAVAAGLVLLALGGIGGWALGQDDTSDLERQAAAQQQVVDAAAQGTLRVSRAEGEGDARATLLSVPGSRTAFVMLENAPALPAGKRYQSWYIAGAKAPVPGQLSDEPRIWLQAKDAPIEDFSAVAFTIEDEDGADQPSQTPFMVIEVAAAARAR